MIRSQGKLSYMRLSTAIQLVLTCFILVTTGWIAFSSASYVLHDRVLAGKEDLIANTRLSYRSSVEEIAVCVQRYSDTVQRLENCHGNSDSLARKKLELNGEIATLQRQLRVTKRGAGCLHILRRQSEGGVAPRPRTM